MADSQTPGADQVIDDAPSPEDAATISSVLEDDDEATDSPSPSDSESQGTENPTADDADSEDDGTKSDTDDEADKADDSKADDEADKPDEGDEGDQVDPKEEARRRYEERQAAIQARRERIRETGEEYVKAGDDEYDQRLRNMEVEAYANKVEANENTLIGEYDRVKANPELQIFNPDSPEFNQRVYDKAMRDFSAGYIVTDQQGNFVEVKGSLFEHLKETADLLGSAVTSGKFQQVRDSKKNRSQADPKPAASPRDSGTKDPIMDVLLSD